MMKKSIDHGCLVISLDFEMMWGCHDWSTVDKYGYTNIYHVRTVINQLINLFNKYGIHATFATVGLIFCDSKDDSFSVIPSLPPSYIDQNKSPFKKGYIDGIQKKDECLFFAPDVIKRLKELPNIEIGTHTFSHYFCWEQGQKVEQFDADIAMACKVAEEKELELKSIVFPRNQVSKKYLEVCTKHGILTYRGNARKYFEHTNSQCKSLYNKISRLLDAYINWGGNTTIPYSAIDCGERPLNIPASRMLRPYIKKLSILEPLRLRRIRKEMIHAAKNHELYHLWWHPHNFGANMEKNLAFLEEILKCYQTCHEQYGMQSLTMKECYYKLKNK